MMDSAIVKEILSTANRAIGGPANRNLVSVITGRTTFGNLVLDARESDPVRCIPELARIFRRVPGGDRDWVVSVVAA
ncbi:hypothetical protein [Pseudonocardia sp.]|uniref:hypothetical protein n=1 Tax=Pseudonocardia sp. TaxID=60912 RepID=UPI0026185D38|nr:hypothetical protein [Pseudonocardia sp.]